MPLKNLTVRQIVRTTIRGERVRVVLSNVFGTAPMLVGGASVALRLSEAATVPGTIRPLTFAGRTSATIPAGAVLVTDPVELRVNALTDLLVDLFLPGDTETWPSPLTLHSVANQTNYLSDPGNHAGSTSFPSARSTTSWFLLSRVEVAADAGAKAVVVFGDSITDGTRSTVNTNSRWPDELARRLQAQETTRHVAVLNAAISGNRLLAEENPNFGINALARFDRDVLAQTGATHVIVLEGINDIGMNRGPGSPAAADLIAAYRQLIDRAHAEGLIIYGATLTPFEGAGYFTAEGEAKRQAVNAWLRTANAFDGVIDFDVVIRDPANPTKFLPAYDSGDHLHPNDAGYKAMGQVVDLGWFR